MIQMLKTLTPKTCVTMSTYDHQLYTSKLYQILDTGYIIRLCMKTMKLTHIGRAHEVFND